MKKIPPAASSLIVAACALVAALALPTTAHGQSGMPGQASSRPPAAAGPAGPDQQTAWERRDMGVAPPRGLHEGALHGPTPNQIPGGQIIATKGLLALLQQRDMPVQLIHVLGGGQMLPGATEAAWTSRGGSFEDDTQEQMANFLRQLTRGHAQSPLVFYCASAECWMSYNAAVRAIRLGYKNVLWYRGGLEAWSRAGLALGSGEGGMAAQGAPQRPMQGGRPPGALAPDAFGTGQGARQ